MRARRRRVAVGLFGGLLVLPAVILAVLYWHGLQREREQEFAMVPEVARDAAARLAAAMSERVNTLLEDERKRFWYEYHRVFTPTDAIGDALMLQRSSLMTEVPPEGVVAYFNYDSRDGPDAEIAVFPGTGWEEEQQGLVDDLTRAIDAYRQLKFDEGMIARFSQLEGARNEQFPLVTAAVFFSDVNDSACVERCSHSMVARQVPVQTSDFMLEFYVDDAGDSHAVASRRSILWRGIDRVEPGQDCLRRLQRGFGLRQGMVLDVNWLFEELPVQLGAQILPETIRIRTWGDQADEDPERPVHAEIATLGTLGFQTKHAGEQEFGRLELVVDTEALVARFDARERRFVGLATMLGIALVAGLFLLLVSVHRELQQAERAENFVAAITHELRTPLSAIRLHGEMLRDGWTDDPDKRQAYYERILRETSRLSALVENVLEVSKVRQEPRPPKPGDLNRMVRAFARRHGKDGMLPDDIELELDPNLPHVMLIGEAVDGILDNLLENARKYAPAHDRGGQITFRTYRQRTRVVLEVADRGPGVPPEEQEHVFEAFHRMGNEATRTAPGTGLGLHLVALHARAMGGKARVRTRKGGGSLFQVLLVPAPRHSGPSGRATAPEGG
jgi:signal transduction histidine kinase